MSETLKEDKDLKTANNEGVGSQAVGYVALVKKWRSKATQDIKVHGIQNGCRPCEKIIIAKTIRKCAEELNTKIKKAT